MPDVLWPSLWTLAIVGFAAFTFVIAFGAPFLPTLSEHVPRALNLINLKPGQTLLELGSGDGRVLIAAAERGINAIGYEINPLLVLYSRYRTRKYRDKVQVFWGNYWTNTWPQADGVFVFLLQPYMEKLDKKIIQEYSTPVKLVSFAFHIPGKNPDAKQVGLFLYEYHQSTRDVIP
jgi:SAM-dependent methyltransferase